MDVVHHLVLAAEWDAVSGPTYSHSSLIDEGFIHFSSTAQVPDTSLRYYSDADDLLLVTVDRERLTSELRWENLSGHGEFPHLYGPLDLAAVVGVQRYSPGDPVKGPPE